MSRVTVSLPADVLARLDQIADVDGVTRSDVIREASSHYLADRETSKLADAKAQAVSKGLKYLEDLAASTSGDGASSLKVLHELRGETE